MKEFLDLDSMFHTLKEILTEEAGDNAAEYEDIIEDYAYHLAESFVRDMRKYVHQKDTKLIGNFSNIRLDWDYALENREIKPWGKFDDVVKSVDDGTISDADLKKLQTWCSDWFFHAFGTWGITYNFNSFIAELEEEEEEQEIFSTC